MLGLKFVAWWLTGSVALYSDALESIVNVIAAAAAFWAIRSATSRPTSDHPFGHHKAEYFSAVLEGVLIVVAALLILAEVARNWASPPPLEQPWHGLGDQRRWPPSINAVWAVAADPHRPQPKGRRRWSPTASHIMTDVVTSVGVLAGLVGAIAHRLAHPRSAAGR